MVNDTSALSDADKLRVASSFVRNAPPGEFSETFADVRTLLRNDRLMRESEFLAAISAHNTEQLVPVRVDVQAGPCTCLLTPFNALPDGRFFDPRHAVAFKVDHLRRETSEVAPHSATADSTAESWRSSLQEKLDAYVKETYKGQGNGLVLVDSTGDKPRLQICIESHEFQPKNFWNGRWRSQWSLDCVESGKSAELNGDFKIQVHYYEDGNVQLVSHKATKRTITSLSKAEDVIKVIESEESDYQIALGHNYHDLQEKTFKGLRRLLPVSRTKMDWNKLVVAPQFTKELQQMANKTE